MDYRNKVQITAYIICPPEHEAEGDRIVAGHQEWMESTHYREGDKELLQYTVAKGEEDGKIVYVIFEVYKTEAGIDDHASRGDFPLVDDFYAWLGKCDVRVLHKGTVVNSLW